jgi:hypothetical protein
MPEREGMCLIPKFEGDLSKYSVCIKAVFEGERNEIRKVSTFNAL